MVYDLNKIQEMLKELKETQEKQRQKAYNKQVGYAPKCKVCNSDKLNEIESLREQGYTYEEIVDSLELDFSIMALSRHFKNHYPKSQAYKEKQALQMLENIKEAYIKYPFLEEHFKNQPLEYLETFNSQYGFCTDSFTLCKQIKPGTVKNSYGNIVDIFNEEYTELQELKDSYSYWSNREKIPEIKLKHSDKVIVCLNCKNDIQEERLNLLEKIVTYNFLNIPPENQELYFNLLHFKGNPDEFIQMLTKTKDENQAN